MATKTATKKAPRAKAAAKTARAPKKATKAATTSKAETKTAQPQPVHGSICHVEFSTPDLEAAKQFYAGLFGWEFHAFEPTTMYFQTPKNYGPCGCMNQGEAASCSATTIYVNVEDIPTTLAKAETLGASTKTPKTEIPGGHGYYAEMTAPDGNVWGIYCRK